MKENARLIAFLMLMAATLAPQRGDVHPMRKLLGGRQFETAVSRTRSV